MCFNLKNRYGIYKVYVYTYINNSTEIKALEILIQKSQSQLLECMKQLVLCKHSCRISMTQDSSRSFGESPVLMLYQKIKVLNLTTSTLFNESLRVNLFG